MLKQKTRDFADRLLSDSKLSATQAYIDTHRTDNRDTAKTEAHKLLTKPDLKIYMKKHVQMAKRTMVDLASDIDVKPSDRIKAAQDILDRNLGKAIQTTETHNTNLNLNIQASQELSDGFTEYLKTKTQQTE